MRRIHCYGRASKLKQVETLEVQESKLRGYVHSKWPGEEPTFYADPNTSSKTPFHERTAGRSLNANAKSGDVIVLHRLDRAFRSLGEFCTVTEEWKRRKIEVHIVDFFGMTIAMDDDRQTFLFGVLACFNQHERTMISVRTKEALANIAYSGRRHTRFPGYGRQWMKTKRMITRPDGSVRPEVVRVQHDGEREIMRRIVAWRNQRPHVEFTKIREILAKEGAKTKEGREWTVDRIKRAFKAELILQQQELGATR